MILANFAGRSFYSYKLGLPRGDSWRIRFNSDWTGYGSAFTNFQSFDMIAMSEEQDGMPFTGTVGLGPYTALVLSQDS